MPDMGSYNTYKAFVLDVGALLLVFSAQSAQQARTPRKEHPWH